MAKKFGALYVASFCENCGFVDAKVGDAGDRCESCGRFVESDPDVCCAKHEVGSSPYPSGECPMCEEERRVQAERQHMMTRDTRVEPW